MHVHHRLETEGERGGTLHFIIILICFRPHRARASLLWVILPLLHGITFEANAHHLRHLTCTALATTDWTDGAHALFRRRALLSTYL